MSAEKLEELQEKLNEEAELWEKEGMTLDNTSHSNSSLYLVKQQLQAIIDLLLNQAIISEDDINIRLKELLLSDMRAMRQSVRRDKMDALLGKRSDITLPKSSKIFGSDGIEIDI